MNLFIGVFAYFLLGTTTITSSSLTIGYEIERPVLQNLNLSVEEGELILITGQNGSGKTTLLRTLARRHSPFSLGVERGNIKIREGSQVSLIAQRPNSQLFTHSVKEEIATPYSFMGMDRQERKERVNITLERFKIKNLKERDPETLSSGQKQMVNCACVGQMNSSILLLDEPFAVLDEQNSTLLRSMIRKLKENGCSIIVVDHSPTLETLELTNRIYLLENGKLREIDAEVLINDFTVTNIPEDLGSKTKIKSKMKIVVGREYSFGIFETDKDFHTAVIEGPNGSGKTTCLLTLLGTLPPIEGKIPHEFKLKKKLFVPQDPISFFRKLTIKDEANYRGINLKNIEELKDWFERPVYSFSEGEKKWISLVLAFNSDAEILLLDEPTFALDRFYSDRFYSLLSKNNKVVILATHDSRLKKWGRSGTNGVLSITFTSNNKRSYSSPIKPRMHPISGITFLAYVLISLSVNILPGLLILFGLLTLLFVLSNGVQKTLKFFWGLRFILLISIILHSGLLILSPGFSILAEFQFILRICILFLSFSLFGLNMNPDETVDLMIKIGLPSSIAWAVGTSARQAKFFVAELRNFMEIHSPTEGKGMTWLQSQALFAVDLLIVSYNSAIDRSINMADSLLNRGWHGPHKTIICYTRNPAMMDFLIIFISISLIVITLMI